MCVHVVYGEYICHHCKFILGVSESQKWPDHTDTDISKRPDRYELKWRSHIKQIVSQLHNHCYVIKRASRLICLGLLFVKLEAVWCVFRLFWSCYWIIMHVMLGFSFSYKIWCMSLK